MNAGIKIPDAVIEGHDQLQKHHKFWYHILTIDDVKSEVVIEKSLAKEEKYDYAAFKKEILSRTSPAFIVIDHHHTTKDGAQAEKVFLISWVPESSKIKHKMMFASTKEALKGRLQGLHKTVHAAQESELDEIFG